MKNKLMILFIVLAGHSLKAVENQSVHVEKSLYKNGMQKLTDDQLGQNQCDPNKMKTWTCYAYPDSFQTYEFSFVLQLQQQSASVLLYKGGDHYGNGWPELQSVQNGLRLQKWSFQFSNGASLIITEQELLGRGGRGGPHGNSVIVKSGLLQVGEQAIDLVCK